MLIFKTDRDYGVYLEEDGDDLWITVTNGYCKSYDCIVGSVADACDTKICVEAAYTCFFPAQYPKPHGASGSPERRNLQTQSL